VTAGMMAYPGGTRFRLFAQAPFLPPFDEPETVWVSPPAGTVGPGPADGRMYVIDPIGKSLPYGETDGDSGNRAYLMPPWPGPIYPPALPDAQGHFDHIPITSPEFQLAHLYGVVRRTLDVWEGYFGHRIEWHFARNFDRLELVIQRNLIDNAYMGFGFLEVGYHPAHNGDHQSFTLNFDVVAHEVGHCIVYATVGVPDPGTADAEYYGFHESAADLTALIAALNFESALDDLLETSHGNLYTFNYVDRIAELSRNDQIRMAANPVTLLDFVDGWRDEHQLAQPMTGFVFDTLVDIFHEELVDRSLISASAEDLSDKLEESPDYCMVIQPIFDEAYAAAPELFRAALIAARDTLGTYLAETWRLLPPDNLSYVEVGRTLLAVDRMLSGGRYQRIIEVNLRERAIGYVKVGPRLGPPSPHHHFDETRLFIPPPPRLPRRDRRRLSYRERFELARAGHKN